MNKLKPSKAAGPSRQFVSEPIVPICSSFQTTSMRNGEPGLPLRFRWRGAEYEIFQVLEKWKTTGECPASSTEQYVRRHCFKIETTDGKEMQIYFERQARSGNVKKRWWLASVSPSERND